MTHDVFISYSSQDKTVADAVCAKLESRKIRCWIAPRDVPAGQPYAAALIKAINSSRIVVLILSADSNKSVHVLREVGEAVDNAIPILPLRIEDIEPSEEMRYYIKSLHWLDALSPPRERHLEKLVDSVQALLSVDQAQQSSIFEQEQKTQKTAKARSLTGWMTYLIIILAVVILGGFAYLVFQNLPLKQASKENSSLINATEINAITPTVVDPQNLQVSGAWSDWKTPNFNVLSEISWVKSGENSYTSGKQTTDDVFLWSDELINGDVIFGFDVLVSDETGESCVMIYGDGNGFTEGSLLFMVGGGFARIEKDSIYHNGENALVVNSGTKLISDQTYKITIEIIGNKASLYIDGENAATTIINNDIVQHGRIAFVKHWESNATVTYSNIKLKVIETE